MLVGLSRKTMLGALTGRPVDEREFAGVAAHLLALPAVRASCAYMMWWPCAMRWPFGMQWKEIQGWARKYFGTDGVRGRVGESPITPEFVMRLGYAAGKVLAADRGSLPPNQHPTVLIGKDTRISGYMLEAALQAGLMAAGVNVLTDRADADAGGGLPDAGIASAGGSGDFGLAQSVRG